MPSSPWLDRLRRLDPTLAGLWLLCLVSGLLLYGPQQMDELGQITAFALYKLGIVAAADLPWEFGAQIRPWLQPAVAALLMRPFVGAGYVHPPMERLLVLAQLPLVTLALVGFARLAAPLQPLARPALFRRGALTFSSWFFLPSMLMRHSSEAWAASLLVIALVLWQRGSSRDARTPLRTVAFAGFVAGLAFWSRFQVGLFIAPFWLALALTARRDAQARARLGAFAFGLLATVAVAVPLDAWGYGAWVLTPWRYFATNLLAGKAAEFGVEPPWFFFTGVAARTFNPLIWAWLASALWAARRDPLRRAVGTGLVIFIAAHGLIAHKEDRFLLPMAGPAALLLILWWRDLASAPTPSRTERWLAPVWYLRALSAVGLAATLSYTATGLVKDRHRIERALWDLPAPVQVFAAADLFGRFDAVFAGTAEPDKDFVKSFLLPPGVRYVRVLPDERAAACAMDPRAWVLLTTVDLPRDTPNPVDVDRPAFASFPPAWVGRLAATAAWYRRLWRFKLVRCADLLPSSAVEPPAGAQ